MQLVDQLQSVYAHHKGLLTEDQNATVNVVDSVYYSSWFNVDFTLY